MKRTRTQSLKGWGGLSRGPRGAGPGSGIFYFSGKDPRVSERVSRVSGDARGKKKFGEGWSHTHKDYINVPLSGLTLAEGIRV